MTNYTQVSGDVFNVGAFWMPMSDEKEKNWDKPIAHFFDKINLLIYRQCSLTLVERVYRIIEKRIMLVCKCRLRTAHLRRNHNYNI